VSHPDAAAKRSARLLRFYPKEWRNRYGEEFAELLAADLAERPRCRQRTADVIAHGLLARVSVAGVPGTTADPAEQVRAGLVVVGGTVAAFLTFGVAMWSQVVIGWRWRPPATPAVAAGMLSMSAAVLVMVALILVAVMPLTAALARALLRREKGFTGPAAIAGTALVVLVVGGLHFNAQWPGSGGRPWGSQALVPSGVASFCWAITRGVSSFWFHPHALARFNGGEIGWMVTSLVAIAALVVSSSKIVRRLRLTPRVLRFEAILARMALVVMTLFAVGAAAWVVAGRPVGPTGVYQVGAIDQVGLVVLGLTLATAGRALARIKASGRPTVSS
jgi:hypothetical protein